MAVVDTAADLLDVAVEFAVDAAVVAAAAVVAVVAGAAVVVVVVEDEDEDEEDRSIPRLNEAVYPLVVLPVVLRMSSLASDDVTDVYTMSDASAVRLCVSLVYGDNDVIPLTSAWLGKSWVVTA